MVWSYTGDPSSSLKDEYRFHIGDTDENEPILQDGEIQFIIAKTASHYSRLYYLFDAAANKYAKDIEMKVGPIEEKPLARRAYYERKAREYKSYNSAGFLSNAKIAKAIFTKGMHDYDKV